MLRQPTLRPSDVVVACQLAVTTDKTFVGLATTTGLSVGETHNAVRRLALAGLLSPGARRPVGEVLLRFLVYGVPHAFPAVVGPETVGVATALGAPVFEGVLAAADAHVWPDPDGAVRGLALTPLFSKASALPKRNPVLYGLLTLIDALRVGQVRERKVAEELLRDRLLRAHA